MSTQTCPSCGASLPDDAPEGSLCPACTKSATAQTRAMKAPVLETIGDFEVLDKLGEGGMGAVYRARQVSLDRIVALKVLPEQAQQEEDSVSRFEREAKVAASLVHPNLVRVYASGAIDGTHFIAMELVEGENLHQRLRRGALAIPEALRICADVARALQCGWDGAQLIHRDIKPSNIYLSNEGEAKLGDLGIAKSLLTNTTGLTQTGTMMGTPHYISPEQARAERNLDFRADIYSLGCTLFHCLTGRTPYMADDPLTLMNQHLMAPPPALLKALPQAPLPLARLVGRMLKKSRHERHANYTDLIAEMDHVRDQIENGTGTGPSALVQAWKQTAPPSNATPPRARPATTTVAPEKKPTSSNLLHLGIAAGVVVLGALAFVFLRPAKRKPATAATRSSLVETPSATKDAPFVNSLGMKFVPVPGTDILLCMHETRRRDYAAFAAATPGVDDTWRSPAIEGTPVEQGDDHPVILVNWQDATDFCAWLSRKEGRTYRLPTEHEWNLAIALDVDDPKTITPTALAEKLKGQFPWGRDEKDGQGKGNYESKDDTFPGTAPVMSFKPNPYGFYDLGGNAWELCEDWFDSKREAHVIRGCGYRNFGPYRRSGTREPAPSTRQPPPRDYQRRVPGFRVALGPPTAAPIVSATSAPKTATLSPAPSSTTLGDTPPQPVTWIDATESLRADLKDTDTEKLPVGWRAATLLPNVDLTMAKPGDVVVRMRFRGLVGMKIRTTNNRGAYSAGVNSLGNSQIQFTDFAQQPALTTNLTEPKGIPGFQKDAVHELIFAAQGSELRVWLDGELRARTSDTRLTEGSMRLRAEKGTMIEKIEWAELPPATPTASASGANLLPNASFEEVAANGIPVGWRSSDWSGKATWSTAGPEHAHRGSRAAYVRSEGGADSSILVRVSVKEGASYQLSAWVKTKGVQGAMGAFVNRNFTKADQGGDLNFTAPFRSSPVTGDSPWTRVEKIFTVTGANEIEIACAFGGWGQSTGEAWFDDISLVEVPGSAKPAAGSPVPSATEPWQDVLRDPTLLKMTGAAEVQADVLHLGANGIARRAVTDPPPRNGAIRMRTTLSTLRLELFARNSGEGGVYIVTASNRFVSLSRYDAPTQKQAVLQSFPLREALPPDSPYTLELRAVGDVLTVKLNGEVLGAVTDATLTEGSFAVRALGTDGKTAVITSLEFLDLDTPAGASAAPALPSFSTPATATKDTPFTNSLGMKFVPVPISGGPTDGRRVLFSVWETRVQDYEAFANETNRAWMKPAFPQEPTHPVVNVTWGDAQAFCGWLTARDRKAGTIKMSEVYRLPSDHEWSCAVGIDEREKAAQAPSEKAGKIADLFPWGDAWPPPARVGNFCGAEAAGQPGIDAQKIELGYRDDFPTTAPVGSFPANAVGLFDLSGNVAEWCADLWQEGEIPRVVHGSSFSASTRSMQLSSYRTYVSPGRQVADVGFRVVLAPVP